MYRDKVTQGLDELIDVIRMDRCPDVVRGEAQLVHASVIGALSRFRSLMFPTVSTRKLHLADDEGKVLLAHRHQNTTELSPTKIWQSTTVPLGGVRIAFVDPVRIAKLAVTQGTAPDWKTLRAQYPRP